MSRIELPQDFDPSGQHGLADDGVEPLGGVEHRFGHEHIAPLSLRAVVCDELGPGLRGVLRSGSTGVRS